MMGIGTANLAWYSVVEYTTNVGELLIRMIVNKTSMIPTTNETMKAF